MADVFVGCKLEVQEKLPPPPERVFSPLIFTILASDVARTYPPPVVRLERLLMLEFTPFISTSSVA